MSQLSICKECLKKHPECRIRARQCRYINNFTVHEAHEIRRCGFCNAEIKCNFCRPAEKGERKCEKKNCGMVMLNRHYDDHKRMHDDDRIYRCARCGEGFIQKGHLIQHLRIHTGEKPYLCESCGHSFRQKSHLAAHEQLVHSELRSFICQLCGAAYKISTDLNKHMHAAHQAEYPPCNECGEKFVRRSDLRNHMALHHHVTQVINDIANGTIPILTGAPYYCGACGEPFINECFKMDHERANDCEENDDDAPPKKKQKIDADDLNDLILKFAELKINDD